MPDPRDPVAGDPVMVDVLDSIDGPVRRRRWPARIVDRVARTVRRNLGKVLATTGVLLFLLVYFAPQIFVTVHSGEVGVLYSRFGGGTRTEDVLGEGLKTIWPWDRLFIYNVRVQEAKHTMNVLTSEGLTITLHLSIRYRPEVETIGLLHQQVGQEYEKKIVIPEVESELRTVMGQFTMRDVYSAQQGLVQRIINDSLEQVSQKFVRIDDVLLVGVELPPTVKATVEEKMAQKEKAESYEYRLEVERQEAERRRIEAEGLRTANDILDRSLTPQVLQWKGIEASTELAKSPNAKTIIMGNGKSNVPILIPDGTP